jgi:hypothetical protein
MVTPRGSSIRGESCAGCDCPPCAVSGATQIKRPKDRINRLERVWPWHSLGKSEIDFEYVEHLDVWGEEGWVDASTHRPLQVLGVTLAPSVRLEIKYVVEGDEESGRQ